MFFTAEVWDLLINETNRYANTNLSRKPKAHHWFDVPLPEMKAFIGMAILMGILKLPRLEMYWQTIHEVLATPGISSIMSRIRWFEQIFCYLHLADNSLQISAGDPGHDKLFKVWRFVDLVTTEFESLYTLHQPVTIGEADSIQRTSGLQTISIYEE